MTALAFITAHPAWFILALLVASVITAAVLSAFMRAAHGPTHQHPSRDSAERQRGGRVDQHHEAR